MKISSIIAAIEEVANPALQADWDKSGLQIASMRDEANRVAVFLDPLPKYVERALDAGANFLLCHHPLSLKPSLPNRRNLYFNVIRMAMRANAPLYAAHTSLDVNPEGPAGWLGRELGLVNRSPLEKVGDKGDFGYGEIGDLASEMPFGALVNLVLKLAKMECANLSGPIPAGTCSRVAYCGGSGSSLLEQARDAGADLYITGDIKYHAALDAEIAVLDVGHHSLEEEMMRRFALLLTEKLPEIDVEFFPSQAPFRRACR